MDFDLVDIILLPALLIVGAITSWEDYRIGKIRNKWLVMGFIYGIAVYIFFLLPNVGINSYIFNNYHLPVLIFWQIVLNTLIAVIASFLLWRFGYISAGDAKLFIIYCWLLPFKYYSRTYLPAFPSFALLINMYLPLLLLLFIESIWYLFKRPAGKRKKKQFGQASTHNLSSMGIESFIWQIINFISLIIIFNFIRNIFSPWLPEIFRGNILLFLVFYIGRRYIYNIFKNKKYLLALVTLALLAELSYLLIYGPVLTIEKFWIVAQTSIVFLIAIILLQNLFEKHLLKTALRKIKIKNLKVGMTPLLKKRPTPMIGLIGGSGITKEQIEILKKWGKDNDFKEMEIYRKAPFAHWMLLGVIITIVMHGSLLHLFLDKISN